MSIQKYIILLLPTAFSVLLVKTSGFKLDPVLDDSENNLANRNDTVTDFLGDQHSNVVGWNYRKLCMSENASNICMEVGMPSNGSLYPKKLRIRRSASASENSDYSDIPFFLDSSSSCKVPKDLKTAEVRCKMWPSSITCKAYCVYGTTYREGIVRTASCKYKQNRWSEEFEECKPFMDCKLKLKSPGFVKCIGNNVLEAPRCQVQCQIFEDHDAIESKSYSCKSDGRWNPALPFCVEMKGTPLVPAPRITEHTDLKYP